MLSSRIINICFLVLFLAACTGLSLQSGLALKQTISADRTRLEQNLLLALKEESTHQALYTELQNIAPIHYLFIHDQDTAQQSNFGRYQEPSHPFAFLLELFPESLVIERHHQGQDLTLQLNGDHYLEHATQGLILLLIFLLSILVACLTIARWQISRARQQFSIFQAGLERLPTFELPNAMKKLSGPWRSLSGTLTQSLEQIKQQFYELNQKQSSQTYLLLDPVTGLKTRAVFEDELANPREPETANGYLILLRAKALAEINERLGNSSGDHYLNEIAKLVKQSSTKLAKATCYRYGATDFLLKLPTCTSETAHTILKALSLQLEELANLQQVSNAGTLGGTIYKKQDHTTTLLNSLDTAINIAESQGFNGYYLVDSSLSELGLDADQWLAVIQDVIENRRLRFIRQKIRATNDNMRLYTELLVRLQNEHGHPLPTASTFNMAAHHGLVTSLDKLVITCLFRELVHDRDPNQSYGINLANHSFCDPEFMQWLNTRLQDQPQLANRLVFEINERSIQQNAEQATEWVERLHRLGARICIENFGTALTSFRVFQMLKPDYIKLEPSLTRGIETDLNNQSFIRLLLEFAERMNTKVIAAHVEMADEKVTLETLGIHGLQGHYISMPESVNSVHQPVMALS